MSLIKNICIVGKGTSLISKNLSALIDEHDVVIRVNNIPDNSNRHLIGNKTNIFSTRSKYKLKEFLNKKPTECETWICSENFESVYKDFDTSNFKFVTNQEVQQIKAYFLNFLNLNLYKYDKPRGFLMPDTGITTILLSVLRFSHLNAKINVCGFDMYKNGNNSIYGFKPNSSLFTTPVLQQMLVYKKLIKTQAINELN